MGREVDIAPGGLPISLHSPVERRRVKKRRRSDSQRCERQRRFLCGKYLSGGECAESRAGGRALAEV
jgi:hypothetical protein